MTPEVASIVAKIDELEQQSKECLFQSSEMMDILSTALSKPDYPSQVHGQQFGMGIRDYWRGSRPSSQKMYTQDDLDRVEHSLREEISVLRELVEQLANNSKAPSTSYHKIGEPAAATPSSTKGSASVVPLRDPATGEDGNFDSTLSLDVLRLHVVVHCLVDPNKKLYHNLSISTECHNVIVMKVIPREESSRVSIPDNQGITPPSKISRSVYWMVSSCPA